MPSASGEAAVLQHHVGAGMSAAGEPASANNGMTGGPSCSSAGASSSSSAASVTAAAPRRQAGTGAARRAPLTIAELRSKAAFRACVRCVRGLSCPLLHNPGWPSWAPYYGRLASFCLPICLPVSLPAYLRTLASACSLMEKGAADETQLWSVARVMSGTEYEQVG